MNAKTSKQGIPRKERVKLSFSKRKITDVPAYDYVFFDGGKCLEVWITNIKISNKKGKKHLYLIELHCYEGFSMIKFYPKSLKNSGEKKFKHRMDVQRHFHFSEIRKILQLCGDVMYFYLDKNPENMVGFVGQTDEKDNQKKKRRYNSQRFSIYEVFINTFFKRPKYVILDNSRLNDFNIKLIRKAINQKGNANKLTENQRLNYTSFWDNFKSREPEALFELMTAETQKKYIVNENGI